jgi:type IV fimbrial biogenesis protein FimT
MHPLLLSGGRAPGKNTPLQCHGASLAELMFSVTLLALLTAVAAPSLGQFQRSNARAAVVNDFIHSIFLARSRAVMTNGVVSICRSTNGVTCTTRTSNWEDGWIVFDNTDRDQPADRDPGEAILHRNAGWSGGQITSNRVAFSFRSELQADINGTIVFCVRQGKPDDARAIIISHTGRPRVAKRDASNRALNCP